MVAPCPQTAPSGGVTVRGSDGSFKRQPPPTLMVAAKADAWPRAQSSAMPPSERRHRRCRARRTLRGRRASPW